MCITAVVAMSMAGPASPDWLRPVSGLTGVGLHWQDAGVLLAESGEATDR